MKYKNSYSFLFTILRELLLLPLSGPGDDDEPLSGLLGLLGLLEDDEGAAEDDRLLVETPPLVLVDAAADPLPAEDDADFTFPLSLLLIDKIGVLALLLLWWDDEVGWMERVSLLLSAFVKKHNDINLKHNIYNSFFQIIEPSLSPPGPGDDDEEEPRVPPPLGPLLLLLGIGDLVWLVWLFSDDDDDDDDCSVETTGLLGLFGLLGLLDESEESCLHI